MLIGMAAGAAGGGILGGTIIERENGYAAAVAGTVVWMAGIGAAVGYVARGPGEVMIYKAPKHR